MQQAIAIEPGQIFYASWGYEQTNVDFYRVVKLKGDWITLEPIESQESSDGELSMTGRAVPADPIIPTGQPFRRKLNIYPSGSFARIQPYAFAYPWDGQPKRVSSYA